jgi:hypothetical protein
MAKNTYLSRVRSSLTSDLQRSDNPFVRLVSRQSSIGSLFGGKGVTAPDDDDDDQIGFGSFISRAMSNRRGGTRDENLGGFSSADNTVLVQIRDEIRELRRQQSTEHKEDAEQQQQAQETLERNTELNAGSMSPTPMVSDDTDEIDTAVEKTGASGLDAFGNIIKKFMSFSKIIEIAMTVFGALVEAVLVLGAAFVGFKIGEWIEKKLEEKFPNIWGPNGSLQKAENAIAKKLGVGRYADAEKTDKWMKEHGQEAAIAGRKVMAERAAKEKAAQAAAPAAPATPQLDTLEPGRALPSVPEMTPTGGAKTSTPTRVPPATVAAGDGQTFDAKQLTMSDRGYKSLITSERFRPTAYQDTRGRWTIGIGETQWDGKPVSPNNPGRAITRDEAIEHMKMRVKKDFEPIVKKKLKKPVTQGQFDSLVHLAYNSPKGSGKIVDKFNKGEEITQADFMEATEIKENERGLVTRRQNEFAMFASNVEPNVTPPNTLGAPVPSTTSLRAAAPVATGTTQLAAAQGAAPVMVVASNNQNVGGGGASQTPIPVPIRPRPDNTVAAIQNINAV